MLVYVRDSRDQEHLMAVNRAPAGHWSQASLISLMLASSGSGTSVYPQPGHPPPV